MRYAPVLFHITLHVAIGGVLWNFRCQIRAIPAPVLFNIFVGLLLTVGVWELVRNLERLALRRRDKASALFHRVSD